MGPTCQILQNQPQVPHPYLQICPCYVAGATIALHCGDRAVSCVVALAWMWRDRTLSPSCVWSDEPFPNFIKSLNYRHSSPMLSAGPFKSGSWVKMCKLNELKQFGPQQGNGFSAGRSLVRGMCWVVFFGKEGWTQVCGVRIGRAPKYSLRSSCIAFPKGDGWAWGAITQGPSDGKHEALSCLYTVD